MLSAEISAVAWGGLADFLAVAWQEASGMGGPPLMTGAATGIVLRKVE